MTSYIVRRLVITIPVVCLVTFFVFTLLYIGPGDPAALIAGDLATAQDVERIRIELGLDRPFLLQYGTWLRRILTGDLGDSIFAKIPVATMIAQRMEPTLVLATTTLIIAIIIAVPLGVLAAWRAGTAIDRAATIFAVAGFSVPAFVLGYVLVYIFAMRLQWLPVQGYTPLGESVWLSLKGMILPSVSLGLIYVALIARITRASVLEVLRQDYIRTAHAKGLAPRDVLLGHALRNAAVPIATIIGIGVALLISGVVVTETVFGIPGLGRLTVDAVLRRDYPVIQGVTLLFSLIYVLVNLAVDLSYTLFDARVRY